MKYDIFLKKFNIPFGNFSDPIKLSDVQVGFSVYEKGFRKGFKSLFYVYFEDKELCSSKTLKNLSIRVSYGRENEDGSISLTNFNPLELSPIGITSNDDFTLDGKGNFLFKGEIMSGEQVLKIVKGWHLKTTRKWSGAWLRFKILILNYLIPSIIKLIFNLISFFKKEKASLFSYRQIERLTGQKLSELDNKGITKEMRKTIKIFEYEIEIINAFIYTVTHLIFFIVFYCNKNYFILLLGTGNIQMIKSIFTNSFLTITYGVSSLILFDFLIQKIRENHGGSGRLLDRVLVYLQNEYYHFSMKSVKI